MVNGSCIEKCPEGTIFDMYNNSCLECHLDNCLKCNSSYQCETCQDGFFN
jgi:hypothetical protein